MSTGHDGHTRSPLSAPGEHLQSRRFGRHYTGSGYRGDKADVAPVNSVHVCEDRQKDTCLGHMHTGSCTWDWNHSFETGGLTSSAMESGHLPGTGLCGRRQAGL